MRTYRWTDHPLHSCSMYIHVHVPAALNRFLLWQKASCTAGKCVATYRMSFLHIPFRYFIILRMCMIHYVVDFKCHKLCFTAFSPVSCAIEASHFTNLERRQLEDTCSLHSKARCYNADVHVYLHVGNLPTCTCNMLPLMQYTRHGHGGLFFEFSLLWVCLHGLFAI